MDDCFYFTKSPRVQANALQPRTVQRTVFGVYFSLRNFFNKGRRTYICFFLAVSDFGAFLDLLFFYQVLRVCVEPLQEQIVVLHFHLANLLYLNIGAFTSTVLLIPSFMKAVANSLRFVMNSYSFLG